MMYDESAVPRQGLVSSAAKPGIMPPKDTDGWLQNEWSGYEEGTTANPSPPCVRYADFGRSG